MRSRLAGVRLAHLINNPAAGTVDFPSMFEGW